MGTSDSKLGDLQVAWDSENVANAVAALGYAQFRNLRGGPSENPAVVLLAALFADDLEVRVIEALPWLVTAYYELNWEWLIARVSQRHVQNRLGFIVALARRIAKSTEIARLPTR
jgi:hypothetical protein